MGRLVRSTRLLPIAVFGVLAGCGSDGGADASDVPTGASCVTTDDCADDAFCSTAGRCAPWSTHGVGYDAACEASVPAGVFAAETRCEVVVSSSDPFPDHVDVLATPAVGRFEAGPNAPIAIVAPFTAIVPGSFAENRGVLRVIRGSDCTIEASLGGVDLDADLVVDWVVSPATPAIADLDGDGIHDVVTYGIDGSLIAFTKKLGVWTFLWKSEENGTPCGPIGCSGWAGPSVHDLDDDGRAEVLRGGDVLGTVGTVGFRAVLPAYQPYTGVVGQFPNLANLDADDDLEITDGLDRWSWDGSWSTEVVTTPGEATFPSGPGLVAFAELGPYGTGAPASAPEIVVLRSRSVTIYASTGERLFPTIVPPDGTAGIGGGPPTIADFDGDGLVEIGIATRLFYTMIDVDCLGTPRTGGGCVPGVCDHVGPGGACPTGSGIAWSRAVQEASSGVTGSAGFDFEGDGIVEVVAADECFARVYGRGGNVLASSFRSSCTWIESPVVADVDGDGRAEIVVPSNKACSPGGAGIACPAIDPAFPGARCAADADCASGSCVGGYCRCATAADCCAAGDVSLCEQRGHVCVANPALPDPGNVCRTGHPTGVSGIRVLAERHRRWAPSRASWPQHAYAAAAFDDLGRPHRTSAWLARASLPGHNHVRVNVAPADAPSTGVDLTVRRSTSFLCSGSDVQLTVPVCNRGADRAQRGVDVELRASGTTLCVASTVGALAPGSCEDVTCSGVWPGSSGPVDVEAVLRPTPTGVQCRTGNDRGVIVGVDCPPP